MIGKAGSHYVILLYCETLLQVLKGTVEPRIIGGVGIIGGLDIAIIINNRGIGIIGGLDQVEKIV